MKPMKKYNPNEILNNPSPEFKKQIQRLERNARRREMNQFLRDITGTSARAAREDMGI